MNFQPNSRITRIASRLAASLVITSGLLGSVAPVAAAPSQQASAPASGLTSPASFLNPDGTMKLDGSFSGSLDLSGWDVQIDPQRGPVLAPKTSTDEQPLQTAAPGQWADVGYGTGDLNNVVNAMAVMGGNVIMGGSFSDVGGNPNIDYIASWNGSSWSAVGDNGSGGSVLNSTVQALLVDGTDLYAGGWFNNLYNDSVYLPEADYVAKFDGTDWSALGSNGSGNGSLNNGVFALAILGGDLYVGGGFTNVNDGGMPAAGGRLHRRMGRKQLVGARQQWSQQRLLDQQRELAGGHRQRPVRGRLLHECQQRRRFADGGGLHCQVERQQLVGAQQQWSQQRLLEQQRVRAGRYGHRPVRGRQLLERQQRWGFPDRGGLRGHVGWLGLVSPGRATAAAGAP